jgi:hypothetical protein
MPRLKRSLTRGDVVVIIVITIAVIASIIAVIRWDLRRECVRWATRIDATRWGSYSNYVCVEYAPPRDRR